MSSFRSVILAAGSIALVLPVSAAGRRVAALDDGAWASSAWISATNAPVVGEAEMKAWRAAGGTSWFVGSAANRKRLRRAKWMTAGLGVYEVYVNGRRIGEDFLKPGFTHAARTKYAYTYDVTDAMKTGAGERNVFAAEVSAGWWRDKVNAYAGKVSAFRGVVELTYEDGERQLVGTGADTWSAAVGGPVTHAAIFDGEEYDARVARPFWGGEGFAPAVPNDEFKGDILPENGADVHLRRDLTLRPTAAYCWKGTVCADVRSGTFGRVVKTRTFAPDEAFELEPGETLVVDFGQNSAAVPELVMRAKKGAVLTCEPGEALNDANGERSRGNDGPAGSVYRANLRIRTVGARMVYTFGSNARETYLPRFSFFGYRYVSITSTAKTRIESIASVPVTSIAQGMETGRLTTGHPQVNRLISNARWGQRSNYLSVPTDTPQRFERNGWAGDTQIFSEAGAFFADTDAFLRKWMRDMRDSQHELGGFGSAAPTASFGRNYMRFGWADAGVIVPWTVWRQFGDRAIVDENWAAMEKHMARVSETRYEYAKILGECRGNPYADWLSYEDYETFSGRCRMWKDGKKVARPEAIVLWNYLGACYWLQDARMMRDMAAATGRDAAKYEEMAATALRHLRTAFVEKDGMLPGFLRKMQTPAVFALRLGIVEGAAWRQTLEALVKNINDHGGCLQTGFLGTSYLMETLTDCGRADVAYTLLLQRRNPSWLYSVDQGATTVWERWNTYCSDKGFESKGMNSFNTYAYGAVVAWIFRTAAGISADVAGPGFTVIRMSPAPDRRLGEIDAAYDSVAGTVKSAWRYEGRRWLWDFTVPAGATARVTLPGETDVRIYGAGDHHAEKDLD